MVKFWMRGRFFTCSFFIRGKENVLLNVFLTVPSAINVRVVNEPTNAGSNPKDDLKSKPGSKVKFMSKNAVYTFLFERD